LAREFPRTLANFTEPKKSQRVCASAEHNTTTSCCVVHAYSVSAQAQNTTRLRRVVSLALRGRIVYRQKHDYVVLSLTWRRRTTIGAIEFRIKNNLFI
jgi:hypothetical protein